MSCLAKKLNTTFSYSVVSAVGQHKDTVQPESVVLAVLTSKSGVVLFWSFLCTSIPMVLN